MIACREYGSYTIPQHWFNHSATLTDVLGATLAMFYATFGYLDKLPRNMLHDPTLVDDMGWTVAMRHYTKKYNYKLPVYNI